MSCPARRLAILRNDFHTLAVLRNQVYLRAWASRNPFEPEHFRHAHAMNACAGLDSQGAWLYAQIHTLALQVEGIILQQEDV